MAESRVDRLTRIRAWVDGSRGNRVMTNWVGGPEVYLYPEDVEWLLSQVDPDDSSRRKGTVTRWDVTSGFITADDGTSWCVSKNSTGGRGALPVGAVVSWVGRPVAKPGKKYPEAYDVRVEGDRG